MIVPIGMFLCVLVTSTNITYGQMTLDDLINYALENSRDIKSANLQLEEVMYQRKETLGHGLPQVEASGSYSKMMLPEISLSDEVVSMVPVEYAPMLAQIGNLDALYTATLGVQVTQLIYNQSYLTGLKTTKKAKELYQLLRNKTEEEVIEEVATSYYQTLSLMLQLNTVNKSLVNLNEIYRIVDLNYKNDLVKESDVNRLKVTITNLEVNQQTIKNVIDMQINYLKALSGMPSDTTFYLDTTSMDNDKNLLIQSSTFLLEGVPSYQVLLKQRELNDQEIKLAKAEYCPTLAAFGQFNYSSYNIESNIEKFNNMNTIGVQLSVPIFTSGINQAKVKQAQLKMAQTEETILKTKDLLSVSYSSAFSEYQTAYSLLDVQKENRDLAFKVYKQTSLQYKEGMASMADVLNVNTDFLQAESSYNQQIIKCRLSEIKMMKSSGSLKQLVNKN